MNILRTLLVPAAFAAATVLPAGAFAQTAATAPMTNAAAPCANMVRGEHHGPNMMAALNLSPAQKAQLKQIHQQFRAAHPCGQGATPAQRAQLRQQIMNVLTPQQRANFKASVSNGVTAVTNRTYRPR